MRIYVVMGTTGEYSDRTEWPVKAFTVKRKAERLITLATEDAKRLESERETTYSNSPEGSSEHDPKIQMDYTGTEYFYYEVELA